MPACKICSSSLLGTDMDWFSFPYSSSNWEYQLPGVPILIVMGALAGTGGFEFLGVVGSALAGSLSADLIWYQLGRRYGRAVLNLMCRISLEPDYCVRRAEDTFAKRGVGHSYSLSLFPASMPRPCRWRE